MVLDVGEVMTIGLEELMEALFDLLADGRFIDTVRNGNAHA
jgi:hypothetical protein